MTVYEKQDAPRVVEAPDVVKSAYHRAEVIALNTLTTLKALDAAFTISQNTRSPQVAAIAYDTAVRLLDVLEAIGHATGAEVLRVVRPPLLVVPGVKVLQ